MRIHELAGKYVVIWGSGREAGATIRALRRFEVDAKVRVLDENVTENAILEGVSVESFDESVLRGADVVVRSPGISKYRAELDGCTVTTATNLWFAEPHAPVIAITGTKGKSTSSSLTAHLLEALGQRALLAGNIGQSPLDLLGEPEPDFWVLELSSFQVSDLDGHPRVAAITSFSPEHLDWHGNVANYESDKTRLLDLAEHRVINPIDDVTRSLLQRFPDATQPDPNEPLPPSNLLGRHNAQLIRLVFAVLRAVGVDTAARSEELAKGLATFQPLPHRLEPAGEVNGVLFVNDSLSTTPIATMAALGAFEDRPVTVLVGGYDRGVSYDDLGRDIRNRSNVQVITLPDCGDRIAEAIGDTAGLHHADGLADAMKTAVRITPAGGVVLLSPGAASFGHFIDYADRGRQFKAIVEQLTTSGDETADGSAD